MNPITFESHNEADTCRLGAALAKTLPAGTVVALNGTLGAGKTRLVQAVAEALGIPHGQVVSPTFVLMQEHHGDKSIYHLDAYRIRDDDEFLQLGVEEHFGANCLVFIEWAERVAACLPANLVTITIDVLDENSRRFTIEGLPGLAQFLDVVKSNPCRPSPAFPITIATKRLPETGGSF